MSSIGNLQKPLRQAIFHAFKDFVKTSVHLKAERRKEERQI